MKKIVFLMLLVFITSCNTQTVENNPINTEVDVSSDVQAPLVSDNSGINNEYTFFLDDDMQESLEISHAAGEKSTVYFINSQASSMNVKIDFINNPGNFRLTQIIAPDGTSDGPFGIDTDYDLTQFGGYQLIFSESSMQGDSWDGKALITVTLQK